MKSLFRLKFLKHSTDRRRIFCKFLDRDILDLTVCGIQMFFGHNQFFLDVFQCFNGLVNAVNSLFKALSGLFKTM